MSELEDFLQAIDDDPADETNWLVMADWLEDNGDPRRAELVRLQRSLPTRLGGEARRHAEERVRDLLFAGVAPCVPLRHATIGMKLALVPAGSFRMGSPVRESRRMADETLHPVRITRPFWMGVYAVTQAQYQAVMDANPSHFVEGRAGLEGVDTSRFPVDSATWEEADRFCRTLTRRERREASGWEYRLPTEAEWEYACRAWTSTRWPFHFGRSIGPALANFDARHLFPIDYDPARPTIGHPVEVGTYRPNAFGLYDMHGNIDEWCSDWFDGGYYAVSLRDDPTGPPDGQSKCYRGGAWSGQGEDCRAAVRIGRSTDDADSRIGFRVVLARVRG
jgi:uncharacterized protein (TIGR02996 family)